MGLSSELAISLLLEDTTAYDSLLGACMLPLSSKMFYEDRRFSVNVVAAKC